MINNYTIKTGNYLKKGYTEYISYRIFQAVGIYDNKTKNEEFIMPLIFYPHTEDTQKGTLAERIEVLMEAAERYKAIILDVPPASAAPLDPKKRMTPRELTAAYNWEEIARVLTEIRESPEITKEDKLKKAALLTKLAEVYEVLRAAKMSKLEAVRLALIGEAAQLKGSSTQVA